MEMKGKVGGLVIRSGSYGSFRQHLLHIHATPLLLRNTACMAAASRDKYKFLPREFRILLLIALAVLLLMFLLSAFTKDDVAPEGPNIFYTDIASESTKFHHRFPLYVHSNPSTRTDQLYRKSAHIDKERDNKNITGQQNGDYSSTSPNTVLVIGETKSQPLPPVVDGKAFVVGHPCEKFTFLPPPADRKRIGPRACPVCYLPVEQAISKMPSVSSMSPVIQKLTYIHEENPARIETLGGSVFGGYPSLQQRSESFDIKESMNVHCGFVKGRKPGQQTGFDIDDADLFEMEQCHGIVVASAIFGKYDIIQQPKNISELAKENVCFYMFVDEETKAYINNSSAWVNRKKVGLWRVIVIHNLPYVDARRNGKVPKLLLHRIFPNARYSIWIDGKLELVVDPYQILERFLWRNGATFAISQHYKRFDVFEEAEANKAAGKYENASIDFQIDFYKTEGLTPYSRAKLPITSDVPEGCVIIKEHIPITNLFTCLWFNEVDRFTSRDQLSFSTVRDKIMSKVDWRVNMFLDCERRNFVVQGYHRELLEHMPLPKVVTAKETPIKSTNRIGKAPVRKPPLKRGRERKSRRHRKTAAGSRDLNSVSF